MAACCAPVCYACGLPMPCRVHGPRDPCAVETAPLAQLLDEWLLARQRERPSFSPDERSEAARRAAEARWGLPSTPAPELSRVDPVEWLCEKTGLEPRVLNRIRDRRRPYTDLFVADRILTAIGRPGLSGLRVYPNPDAFPAARAACCGSPAL